MNENLDLTKILNYCPEGTKLYSPVYGDVELVSVSRNEDAVYPIEIKKSNNGFDGFAKDGRLYTDYKGECMLFPSKDQRDWSKFKVKKPKFDPKTLKPFDKVLVRISNESYTTTWCADFVAEPSHAKNETPLTLGVIEANMVIPYNEDTKHLVGTEEEAPEFYRYWEE